MYVYMYVYCWNPRNEEWLVYTMKNCWYMYKELLVYTLCLYMYVKELFIIERIIYYLYVCVRIAGICIKNGWYIQ